jgi:hypothetical protein
MLAIPPAFAQQNLLIAYYLTDDEAGIKSP